MAALAGRSQESVQPCKPRGQAVQFAFTDVLLPPAFLVTGVGGATRLLRVGPDSSSSLKMRAA